LGGAARHGAAGPQPGPIEPCLSFLQIGARFSLTKISSIHIFKISIKTSGSIVVLSLVNSCGTVVCVVRSSQSVTVLCSSWS